MAGYVSQYFQSGDDLDKALQLVAERDAEAWAVGERNGVPVDESDKAYQNNAKYFAENAGGSAKSAKSSEAAAQKAAEDAERFAKDAEGAAKGDMMKSTYDPTGKNEDIFAYADSKVRDVPKLDASGLLSTSVLPTVPLTRGGTGQTSAAAALYALLNGATALDAAGLDAGDCIGVGDASAATGRKVTLHDLAAYLVPAGGGVRIETGSYVGTGTIGKDNPQSITFSFAPKLVFMVGNINNSGDVENYFNVYRVGTSDLGRFFGMYSDFLTTEYKKSAGFGETYSQYGAKSEDGKTFYWYTTATSAYYQFNSSNLTYYWLAIG